MKHTLVATAFFFLVGAGQAYAQTAVPSPSAPEPKFGAARVLGELKVAGVDAAAERADDAQKFADGGYVSGRVRYALSQPVQQWLEPAAAGDSAGSFAWNISSPGATSLDLVFSHFWLPRGVSVYVYDSSREWVRGPYTDQHNNAQNVLPMPFVPGDSLTIEVTGDPAALAHAKLKVGQVSSGYREFWKPGELQKSGACNVDVACPDRSTWEDQIASVGHFTFQSGGSSFVCSGQMLNTTSNDDRIFSSANHCLSTEAEANSVVVYFNYESDQCRAPGSVSSGQAISRGGFTDTIEGTSLLSTYAPSDFTLLRLNQTPPASYNVFYSGWDHTGNGVAGVAGIHHPAGHAKRISFDFDELCKSPYLGGCDGSSTHWRIAAWDTGTTEGGSSGSGIWNNNGLFVGQLEGGFAACSGGTAQDNDQPDWYGRMDVSWTGNGTPSGRMSDWLDPTNTGAMTFNGRSGCDAPQVQMSSTKGGVFSVGESADFSAAVSGGQAPYTFSWDVDGDGLTDSTDANVSAIYHEPFSGTVTVGIIDGAGCRSSASLGAVVEAPALDLSQVGQPAEVCGDGDSQIEPGESWSYPVTLRNSGSASAVDTFAAFAPAGGASGAAKRFGGPDSFGYTFADSQEPSCSFSFQDIAGTGTQLNFTATDGNQAAAEDDGWADVTLGGTGFDFYGTNLTGVTVSTNGYISTSQQDIGGDVSNDCPLPTAVSSGTGGRIYPLHDDVVIQTAYHQYFENCPRPGESAGSAGCNIFQWNVDGFFGGPSSPNFDFQAILYDGTNQIVYQYGPGNGRQGDSQTIGIQSQANPPFDGLTYACNEPNSVPDNSAVCIFHPSADSPGLSGDIQLERSALAVGAVGSGGSSQVDVTVQLNESFACGDSFSVDYLGSVHAGGFSRTCSASVISGQVALIC
ncbi:MAG: PKD domain-containing protein, partial [Pseudomonadota bacterium]